MSNSIIDGFISRGEMKPLFTKKHYKAIAEVLKGLRKDNWLNQYAYRRLVNLFSADNPKFKEETFKKMVYGRMPNVLEIDTYKKW